MKTLTELENERVNEGLLSWFLGFIKKITASQKTTVQSGPLEVEDVTKITMNKEPVDLNKVDINKFKDSWADKKTGIPDTWELFDKKDKYLPDAQEPMVLQYFIKHHKLTYPAGVVIYDKKKILIENFLTIYAVEGFKCIKNTDEVVKAIMNNFNDIAKTDKDTKYEGFAIKLDFKPMMSNAQKYEFRPSKEDKETLTRKIH